MMTGKHLAQTGQTFRGKVKSNVKALGTGLIIVAGILAQAPMAMAIAGSSNHGARLQHTQPIATLREKILPAAVQSAVAANYAAGRHAGDTGGVASVRSFDIDAVHVEDLGGESYTAAVTEAVLLATAGLGVANLNATCGIDPDTNAWDTIAERPVCAAWHARRSQTGTGTTMQQLGLLRALSDAPEAFGPSLDAIEGYLFSGLHAYTEIVSTADADGVTYGTALLIDAQRAVVHIIAYDWGA